VFYVGARRKKYAPWFASFSRGAELTLIETTRRFRRRGLRERDEVGTPSQELPDGGRVVPARVRLMRLYCTREYHTEATVRNGTQRKNTSIGTFGPKSRVLEGMKALWPFYPVVL
jgi:hypothetical protein